MVRKIAIGTLAAATLGGLALGTDVFSYARTGLSSARAHIRSEVPIEFEIERARQEVEQLLPEVRRSLHLIAEEQVEVEQLQKSIARREASLAEQEESILELTADLKSSDTHFVYAGRNYKRHQVEKDLAERFNRFKIGEDTLHREQEVLTAKKNALAANQDTLEEMLSQRKNLEAELERLEARLRTVNARKQIHGLEIDDSQLSRVRTLISSIEKRLDVESAVLAAEGDMQGLIPVEQEREDNPEDIALEVEEYFGSRPLEVVSQ